MTPGYQDPGNGNGSAGGYGVHVHHKPEITLREISTVKWLDTSFARAAAGGSHYNPWSLRIVFNTHVP